MSAIRESQGVELSKKFALLVLTGNLDVQILAKTPDRSNLGAPQSSAQQLVGYSRATQQYLVS